MKEAEVVESKVQSPFTNDDWCEGASDWGRYVGPFVYSNNVTLVIVHHLRSHQLIV